MASPTYYSLLGVEPSATFAEIEAAYTRQMARYNPEQLAELDDELQQVAEQRRNELERAYAVLCDPTRRQQYDVSIGLVARSAQPKREGLSKREQFYALGGVVVALILIVSIWTLTGREGEEARAMGEVNRPAPQFVAASLDGSMVDLSQYRGQVVLLNFWATWCEPCVRELPALESAYQNYRDEGLVVIGVNLTDDEYLQGGTIDKVREFLVPFGVSYPIALDVEGTITTDYRVFPLPTSFFIDGEGNIRYVHVGELTEADVAARFRQLREAAALSQ